MNLKPLLSISQIGYMSIFGNFKNSKFRARKIGDATEAAILLQAVLLLVQRTLF